MPKYQSHKNWNHWNVSLWINNDEVLYHKALNFCKGGNKDAAAKAMYQIYLAGQRMPDGAPYCVSSIRAAMVGM